MSRKSIHLRSSGILAHISSLPSKYGIGDLGPSTYNFINFLASSNQTYWQILPLGPTDPVFGNSPYMTVSAFAGNPLLISPDLLYEDGLITKQDMADYPVLNQYSVNFDEVWTHKKQLLRLAHGNSQHKKDRNYMSFIQNTHWLDDYSLFMALKTKFPGKAWYQWGEDVTAYTEESLEILRSELMESIDYYCFEQYLFFKQWQDLHNYTKNKGIKIFGDIPIYVSLDSADVWANQDIFQLNKKSHLPTHVSGVPADYFSVTGQKWGNPLYRWSSRDKNISNKLLQWWIQRFKAVFELVDTARIDHFRGFESYWSIPAHHETALKGKWVKGPGKTFFNKVFKKLGDLEIVAEDLGEITNEVVQLRDDLGFPGMKVLQFAFDGNPENSFLPYNYDSAHAFVYTGTHDNDTTLGWFLDDRLDDTIRMRIKQLANREGLDSHGIHHDLIYLALSSTATTCIFPLQDILGFGNDCRMNTPGTSEGNWAWRCAPEFLSDEISRWLSEKTALFGRNNQVQFVPK